jgi:hypothetical protein
MEREMKNKTDFYVFADESGTHDKYPCYGIGCLSIPVKKLDEYNSIFKELKRFHGVTGELKWHRIRNSHGGINMSLDIARKILHEGFRFDAIIVYKNSYNNWQNDNHDTAFYKTYCEVLTHHIKKYVPTYDDDNPDMQCKVLIDARNESYDKHDEVLEIITNRRLHRIPLKRNIDKVTKSDSKNLFGIQTVDILIGAITASHCLAENLSISVNKGKQLLIKRLAAMLGWDALHYDTFPESEFNIWHFPGEHRGLYSEKKNRIICFNDKVPYVSLKELT